MKKSTLLLITGIALGLVSGMLLAPDKTYKTRKKWRKKGKQYERAFEEKLAEYKSRGALSREKAGGIT